MFSTEKRDYSPAPAGTGFRFVTARIGPTVHAGLVSLMDMTLFVTVCAFLTGWTRDNGYTSTISGPDDWQSLVKLSVAACAIAAWGALFYRRSSSRPMVLALALGVIFISLDTSIIIEQVAAEAGRLPGREFWITLTSQQRQELTNELTSLPLQRMLLYCVDYLVYIFWAVVILYSGYLGQYLVGNVLRRETPQRRESGFYVAENAGLGLSAGVGAGLVAMALAIGMAALTVNAPLFVREVAGVARIGSSARSEPSAAGATSAQSPPETVSVEPSGDPALRERIQHTLLQSVKRLRIYALVVVLSFMIMAYLTALVLRPRTSTWVACGAVIGVMTAPLAAILATPRSDTLAFLLSASADKTGMFYRLLEISPFALTGLAVSSAVVGDWFGREIIAYMRRRETVQMLKPF